MRRARKPKTQVWLDEPCPGCARPVRFLPGQQINVCGWCKAVVLHAVG